MISMECLWNNFVKFCKILFSYIIGIARLIIWTIILFFSGLQRTLFMKGEIIGVDFKVIPLRCYREEIDNKLAYLDKLCIENPDLVEGMVEEEIPFDGPMGGDFGLDDDNNGEDEL